MTTACHGAALAVDRQLRRAAPCTGVEPFRFHVVADTGLADRLRAAPDPTRVPVQEEGRIVRLGALVPDAIAYELDPAAGTIRYEQLGTDEDWEQVLLSWTVPQMIGLLGGVVLHAVAVRPPFARGVMAFVGPTRSGKSTIAATAARLGWSVLSEDGLHVERSGDGRLVAHPGLLGARIRSRSEGREIRTVQQLDGSQILVPMEVDRVVVLAQRGHRVITRPLATAEAVAALTGNRLSAIPEEPRQQLPVLFEIARRSPVVHAFEDDLGTLGDQLSEFAARWTNSTERVEHGLR